LGLIWVDPEFVGFSDLHIFIPAASDTVGEIEIAAN
jgi:hypothetical protein